MDSAESYIEECSTSDGFGHNGYKFRVMDRQRLFATHHTNSYTDAVQWSRKCIMYWNEQDSLAEG